MTPLEILTAVVGFLQGGLYSLNLPPWVEFPGFVYCAPGGVPHVLVGPLTTFLQAFRLAADAAACAGK